MSEIQPEVRRGKHAPGAAAEASKPTPAAKHGPSRKTEDRPEQPKTESGRKPVKPDFWKKLAMQRPKKKKKLTKAEKKRRLRRKKLLKRILFRVVLSIVTFLLLAVVGIYVCLDVVFKGPSQSFGDLMTVSMLETSALKFVPRLYYSDEEMAAIIERNSVAPLEEETDTSLVVINNEDSSADSAAHAEEDPDGDGLELREVSGATYHGYMLIVEDPSRVSVGVCRENFNKQRGLELQEIAKRYEAVAAINGGGFEDTNGLGNGGMPSGVVVSEGVLLRKGKKDGDNNITVGFDRNNVLVIGQMTGSEAMEKGIRDAVTFGPALVVNGNPVTVKGSGSGYNPRTAIGQRADGAVLMLVIEGRQVNSLGATLQDLIEIMLDFEAVNACNLDGGSSSMMYLNGEYVNNGVVLTGSRALPTGFIVR